jgi:pimeloyl-ACP methyl ester carboxylesterase
MMKIWRRVLIGIAVLVLAASAAFVVWGLTPARPMPEALAAIESGELVTVSLDRWMVFEPTDGAHQTGLIIYPGGRVDPRAYAPAARAIAERGYRVVIVPMPLNLAVFAAGRAAEVMHTYPATTTWAVGGHSLGGAIAALFADENPQLVKGLALWASYPAESNDLSQSGLRVVSVYGTRDGLATREKIDASRALLPASTEWVEIDGGNHAQFGWYGAQSGDLPATITRPAQQEQIVAATLRLLEAIERQSP